MTLTISKKVTSEDKGEVMKMMWVDIIIVRGNRKFISKTRGHPQLLS